MLNATVELIAERTPLCARRVEVARLTTSARCKPLGQFGLTRSLCFVVQGLAAVVAAKCEALTHLQGKADEHMRWISGCRTQPDAATAALLEGGLIDLRLSQLQRPARLHPLLRCVAYCDLGQT
jgi:hypothetical protein